MITGNNTSRNVRFEGEKNTISNMEYIDIKINTLNKLILKRDHVERESTEVRIIRNRKRKKKSLPKKLRDLRTKVTH